MANLLSSLEIGRGALMAQRMNIQVAGSNIANVETDGYSRRRVELKANQGQTGETGIGVSVAGIRRMQSPFLSTLLYHELGTSGQLETYSDGLENLESIFYVSGDASNSALSNAMEQFWNSFDELANNPESLEMRNVVRERGIFLATTLNDFSARLIEFQEKIRENIEMKIEEINRLAKDIAKLNTEIAMDKEAGTETSGLHDKRDYLTDQLARMIDTKISETQNGMLSINVGHKPLVHGDSYNELEVELKSNEDPDYAEIQTFVKLKDREDFLTIEGGELKGLIDISDSVISDYLHDFDQLATDLIKEVNNLHKQGTGLDGSTENDFFAPDLSDDSSINGMAGKIEVSEAIINDSKKIAASETGVIGDAQIAMKIAQLRNEFTMESGTTTFDEFYQGIVSKIGIQIQKTKEDLDVQDQMVMQLKQRKESVTGVSLDEEAINLIRFQKAYQAAAKYISIIDDMLNTIINRI